STSIQSLAYHIFYERKIIIHPFFLICICFLKKEKKRIFYASCYNFSTSINSFIVTGSLYTSPFSLTSSSTSSTWISTASTDPCQIKYEPVSPSHRLRLLLVPYPLIYLD